MPDVLTRRWFSAGAGAWAVFPKQLRADPAPATQLIELFAEIEAKSGGRLGVAVEDSSNGRRYEHRPDERFPMCSTAKLMACAALLARVDAGREDLAARLHFGPQDIVDYSPVTVGHVGGDGMTLAALCEAAITRSDNTANNLILNRLGGPFRGNCLCTIARRSGDAARSDRTRSE